MNKPYADLEIRLLDKQEPGYPVEITLNNEQEFPRGYFQPDTLPWVSTGSPAADGLTLFQQLLADDRLKTAWAEARGQYPQRRLRLRIDAAAPELHAIPWELLREPGAGVPLDLAAAASTPFSRYLAGQWQPGSPILKRPLKMLVAIANPANLADYQLTALKVEQEWADLQAATAGQGELELTLLPQPCTLAALEAALQQTGYHILHFIGHGSYSVPKQQAVLYLADPDNQVTLVTDQQVAAMLARQLANTDRQQNDKLRLVFLASCETATRSATDAWRGLAPRLVQAGVPAVLAMQDFVAVATARQFAQTFYRQLGQHGQVDLAGNEARAALLTANLPGAAIPVLFMRLRSGRLFDRQGEILGNRGGSFWTTLVKNMADGECTPILGPGLTTDLLPSPDEVAATLAAENNYPFADCGSLPRVAQFVATLDDVRLRRDVSRILRDGFKKRLGLKDEPAAPEVSPGKFSRGARQPPVTAQARGLAETIAAANWSERSRELLESEVHHLLADLPLPLYLTTNMDNFMTLALQAQGCQPRRVAIDWRLPPAAGPGQQFPELNPLPSLDNPVVLHLFGSEDDPASLVLTQDNYLDYLARISRDHEHLLPPSVQQALTKNTLLFLGYRLEDLDLKVITRGLLTQLDLKRWDRLRVAVQLEVSPAQEDQKQEIIQHIQKYFAKSQEAQIDVYWGSARQFVQDLHAHWQAYLDGGML